MEYFSSIKNDVEKEEGELSSDDDDGDNRGNVLENSDSAHTVEVNTKRQTVFHVDQANSAEICQIIVIDEWSESAASNKSDKYSINHKRNKSSFSSQKNQSFDSSERNQSFDSSKRNQSLVRCKDYTSDSKYDTRREALEYENRSSCQRSPRGLKRLYAATDDQSHLLYSSSKCYKPAIPEWSAFNCYVSVECSSNGDLRYLIDRRVHENESYHSFEATSEQVETCNDVSDDLRSRLSKHRKAGSRVLSNYHSRVSGTNYPKDNRKELTRSECLPGDESNKSKQRVSRHHTTRNFYTRSWCNSSSVKGFHLSKYKNCDRRKLSVKSEYKKQGLQIQADNRSQKKVARKVKERQFGQLMEKHNHDSLCDSRALEHPREILHESQRLLTSPQMHNNDYAIRNIYSSQDSNHSYAPALNSSQGIQAFSRALLPSPCHKSGYNTLPSYTHPIPYQDPSVPLLTTAPQGRHVGSLSDDIGQKLHSIRFDEQQKVHSQNDAFSDNIQDYESAKAWNVPHVKPQVMALNYNSFRKLITDGSEASTDVFSRLGHKMDNGFSDIQAGVDVTYPRASFSKSAEKMCIANTVSSRIQLSTNGAMACDTRNMKSVHTTVVSEGKSNQHVNDSIMQKNLTKTIADQNSQEKQRLLELYHKLVEENQQKKEELVEKILQREEYSVKEIKHGVSGSSNYCAPNVVRQSRFKLDRTAKGNQQSLYKIDKKPKANQGALPDCSALYINSSNKTSKGKESINLVSSVLPRMNEETTADANLASSLPELQKAITEPQAGPKRNETNRRCVYSSPLRMFEHYRNKAPAKESTEADESDVMSSADTLEADNWKSSAKESTEAHNERKVIITAETQEACSKQTYAKEHTELHKETDVMITAETQEMCDWEASAKESMDTFEREVMIPAETDEICKLEEVSAKESSEKHNQREVMMTAETQGACSEQSSAKESTETYKETDVMITAEAQELCNREPSVKESTETQNETDVMITAETEEMCNREPCVKESTETQNETDVMITAESEEMCHWEEVYAKESSAKHNERQVMITAETQAVCSEQSCAKESTETYKETDVMITAETQELCNWEPSVKESTELYKQSDVMITAETQELCNWEPSVKESTETYKESDVMITAEIQELCNWEPCVKENTEIHNASDVIITADASAKYSCETHNKCDVMVTAETQEASTKEGTETHDKCDVMVTAETQEASIKEGTETHESDVMIIADASAKDSNETHNKCDVMITAETQEASTKEGTETHNESDVMIIADASAKDSNETHNTCDVMITAETQEASTKEGTETHTETAVMIEARTQ